MTFPFKDKTRTPRYFNCVRKLHKLWKNAYVAFSGDVRTGLLLIEDLKRDCVAWYAQEDHYFSLEGENLPTFQKWLGQTYRRHAGTEDPELQLMFLWNYQEGEDVHWKTGVRRFLSPDFRFSGTGPLQVDQCGSGLRAPEFQMLSAFLQGRGQADDPLYRLMFGNVSPANLYTAKKIRNLLVREASRASFLGVSRAFTSVLLESPPPDGWVENRDFPMFVQMLKKLGVQPAEHQTRADVLLTFAMDIAAINERVQSLREVYPQQFYELSSIFTEFALKSMNRDWSAPHSVEEQFHPGEEALHSAKLCETWEQIRRFMIGKGLNPHAMSAIA
ncbi:hypothetical protein [Variovorax sp. Sphag1AA]|uniref:hypothetical protein n=1 Tax=Variovorax sp. Sphag1AA TaxID=2587027 RepID=UPI0016158DD7|nr:hypothetical protein [Variovorax sp. Sphag1AA]MBB3181904.1 hypothetical protein [Variovorax sp. Sphag1AA]